MAPPGGKAGGPQRRRPTGVLAAKLAGVRKPAGKKGGRASLKNMIRGCQRLLAKGELDSKARVAQEAKLAELQAKVEDHARTERERKYAVMYHRVKFFDRVKVERRLKQLEKGLKEAVLEGNEEAVKRTKGQLAEARDHVMYVKHFPKGEKYVSIVKGEGEHIQTERARLMALVKSQQREMAMITEADEGLGEPSGEGTEEEAEEEEEEASAAPAPAVAAAAVKKPGGGSRRKPAEQATEPAPAPTVAPVKRGSRRKPAAAVQPVAAAEAGQVGAAAKAAAAKEAEPPAELLGSSGAVFEADDFFMSGGAEEEDGGAPVKDGMRRLAAVLPKEAHAELEAEAARKKRRAKRPQAGEPGAKWPRDSQGRRPPDGKAQRPPSWGGKPAGGGKPGGKGGQAGKKGGPGAAPAAKPSRPAAKDSAPPAKEAAKQPLRSRAEGGRKRRSKKK